MYNSLSIAGYINKFSFSKVILDSDRIIIKEVIKNGAFREAISAVDNIPLILNHNIDNEIASTKDGTLFLEERYDGLYFEAILLNDDYKEFNINELRYMILKGYVSCSFGFDYISKRVYKAHDNYNVVIVDKLKLKEVSILTYGHEPAYRYTDVYIRK